MPQPPDGPFQHLPIEACIYCRKIGIKILIMPQCTRHILLGASYFQRNNNNNCNTAAATATAIKSSQRQTKLAKKLWRILVKFGSQLYIDERVGACVGVEVHTVTNTCVNLIVCGAQTCC